MKIDTGIQSLARPDNKTIKRSSSQSSSDSQSVQNGGSAFSVTLSSTTEKLVSGTPASESIDWDKVASISNQLAAGTYNISGVEVADKMLSALGN